VRELLLQRGLELKERDFFKEPFSETELQELAAPVGLSELLARRSPSLKQMGLAGQELSEAEMLRLMLQEPRLIRRPVVKIDGQLLVGANLKAVEAALGT
jgi:arsenate reductase-like glutaredoxin family protein